MSILQLTMSTARMRNYGENMSHKNRFHSEFASTPAIPTSSDTIIVHEMHGISHEAK